MLPPSAAKIIPGAAKGSKSSLDKLNDIAVTTTRHVWGLRVVLRDVISVEGREIESRRVDASLCIDLDA